MAYGRMISKDFWISGEFYDKPYWAQVLICAMLCSTDDNGMVRADPRWLRDRYLVRSGSVRGPKLVSITSVLRQYVDSAMLVECEKDGVSYYRFKNFHAHQRLKGARKGREEKGREGMGWEEKGNEDPIFEKRRKSRTEARNGHGLDD